jgi:hypothetical protein
MITRTVRVMIRSFEMKFAQCISHVKCVFGTWSGNTTSRLASTPGQYVLLKTSLWNIRSGGTAHNGSING